MSQLGIIQIRVKHFYDDITHSARSVFSLHRPWSPIFRLALTSLLNYFQIALRSVSLHSIFALHSFTEKKHPKT